MGVDNNLLMSKIYEMTKITPLSDHILIEPLKEERKKGGIILPETADKERQERGKVVAVGPGRVKDSKRVALEVKRGDIILFTKYGPNEIKVDGKEYLIAKEEDILAIIK